MLEQVDIANVLFLDVETVSATAHFSELAAPLRDLWAQKARSINRDYTAEYSEEELAEIFRDRAAIYAEYGRIMCISVGVVRRDKEDQRLRLRLKSFASKDEREVLAGFSELLNQYYSNPNQHFICGHNIKEFDVPYICRRILVNQMPLPAMLDIGGKKPWETNYLLDTMELWKFGDRKAYTSLKLLAAVLDFPSPKDDIDGSQVGRTFWEEGDVDRIAHYCEKDVLATVQLFQRYRLQPLLEEDQVLHIDNRVEE